MRIMFRRFIAINVGVILLLTLGNKASAQAETKPFTVEEYFQLMMPLLELSVQEWQERLEIAVQNKGSRMELAEAFQAVKTKYQQRSDQLTKEAGFGRRQYLDYSNTNRAEMKSYLEEHEEVQIRMQSLRSQINSLIQQVEAVSSDREGGTRRTLKSSTMRTQLPGRIVTKSSQP